MRRTGGFWDSVHCLCLLVVGSLWPWEILDISITKLIPLVFLLSLTYPCLFNDDIKYENERRGGGM